MPKGFSKKEIDQLDTKPPVIKQGNLSGYQKSRGEHYKDIVIAILVTAILAFIGGLIFAGKQQANVDKAVKAVTLTKEAEATPAKK